MNQVEHRLFVAIMRRLEADAQRGRSLTDRLTPDDLAAFVLAVGWGASNGLKWIARINEEIFRAALAKLGTRYEYSAATVIRLQNRAGARALEAVRLATRPEQVPLDAAAFAPKSVHGSAPMGDLTH
jgi:hypothetical protein